MISVGVWRRPIRIRRRVTVRGHVGGRCVIISGGGRHHRGVVFSRNNGSDVRGAYGRNRCDSFCRVFVDDGVETVKIVRSVGDGPNGTIRLSQTVRSLDDTVFAVFFRGFVVAGVRIVYAVLEVVGRIRVDFLDLVEVFGGVCDRGVNDGCFGRCGVRIAVDGCWSGVVCWRDAVAQLDAGERDERGDDYLWTRESGGEVSLKLEIRILWFHPRV